MTNPKYPAHSNLASLKSVLVCSLHFNFNDFYELLNSSCSTNQRRKLRKGRILTHKFLLLNFKNVEIPISVYFNVVLSFQYDNLGIGRHYITENLYLSG